MNDLAISETPCPQIPSIPDEWNYEDSVNRVKPIFYKFTRDMKSDQKTKPLEERIVELETQIAEFRQTLGIGRTDDAALQDFMARLAGRSNCMITLLKDF
jgi:uncharacterized coiled-coil protein SlyX